MRLPIFTTDLSNYMIPCMNKKLFGVDCPGCGIQRSLSLIFQGDFVGAFQMYPAIYALLLLFGFIGVNYFYKIKYAAIIITVLSITSVALILTNYIYKFI